MGTLSHHSPKFCKAAHAEKLGASGIGILPNMFTVPNDVDHLVQWIKLIAGAAPKTPAIFYHIPICTKVTCKCARCELEGAAKDLPDPWVGYCIGYEKQSQFM